jgi:hypothetical protein
MLEVLTKASCRLNVDSLQGHGIWISSSLKYLLQGLPFDVVKAKGCWACNTFFLYLRKHTQIVAPYMQVVPALHESIICLTMPPVCWPCESPASLTPNNWELWCLLDVSLPSYHCGIHSSRFFPTDQTPLFSGQEAFPMFPSRYMCACIYASNHYQCDYKDPWLWLGLKGLRLFGTSGRALGHGFSISKNDSSM